MGKKSRAWKHGERMKQKNAKKAAKKSLYLSLAGTSKKGKVRNRRRMQASGTYKHAHVMSYCGNAGCKRCNPRAA